MFAMEGDGTYIEQLQLSQGTSFSKVDSIPVFVYRGRIYVRNERDSLDYDLAKQLLGKQVGTTKDSISDWSSNSNSSKELPSNIGVSSIYKVSGYDSRFRLMTIDDNSKIGWMYECLNNVYIKDGACLFEELNLRENIDSVTYQTLEEWNSSSEVFHEVDLDDEFTKFIDNLYEAKLIDYGRNTTPNLYENDRFIYYLTMKDKTVNQLVVFSNHFVTYQGLAAYYVFNLEQD
jgi:hypothetical protein